MRRASRRWIVVAVLALALATVVATWLRLASVSRRPRARSPLASNEPARESARGPMAAAAATVPEVARGSRSGHRVLFLGLDGADWELLDRYLSAGAMPALSALIREGRSGIVRTIHPPLSPLVWTSMMTGVDPIRHGILDFTRFDPVTGAREPITSGERKVAAIWNMAGWGGKSVAVFGMWATWPAEPVAGLLVSDRLYAFQRDERAPEAGLVSPAARREWALATLLETERKVDLSALREYLPWLDPASWRAIETRSDPWSDPASALRRILVETRLYHALAVSYLGETRPDLAIVYIQGTDAIGHVFAPYAPPRQRTVSPVDFERYRRVPELYFREIDRMIAEYGRIAEAEGAVLFIASDHGFRWGEGRPERFGSLAAATAGKWHRDDGIFVLHGAGVEPRPRDPEAASVVRVCATLLALLGLPPGKDVEAPPLLDLDPAPRTAVDYRLFYTAAAPVEAPPSSPEEMEKLRALGYVGAGEIDAAPASARTGGSTRTPGSWNNEGLILWDRGDLAGAERAFGAALSLDPGHASALRNLSVLFEQQHRDPDRSDDLLLRAAAAGLPDGVEEIVGRVRAEQKAGRIDRSLRLLDRALEARPDEVGLLLFRGRFRTERGDCSGALADFQTAARAQPESALVWASSALARLCSNDRVGARRDFERSLALDPDQPEVRRFLRDGS